MLADLGVLHGDLDITTYYSGWRPLPDEFDFNRFIRRRHCGWPYLIIVIESLAAAQRFQRAQLNHLEIFFGCKIVFIATGGQADTTTHMYVRMLLQLGNQQHGVNHVRLAVFTDHDLGGLGIYELLIDNQFGGYYANAIRLGPNELDRLPGNIGHLLSNHDFLIVHRRWRQLGGHYYPGFGAAQWNSQTSLWQGYDDLRRLRRTYTLAFCSTADLVNWTIRMPLPLFIP